MDFFFLLIALATLMGCLRDKWKSESYFEGYKDGWNEYEWTISSSADDEVFGTADDDDLAVLMFTAGTTGTQRALWFLITVFRHLF